MKKEKALCYLKVNQFRKKFNTTENCLEFLSDYKWSKSYTCRKCGHTHYCTGKTPFSRRCTRCKHEESATAHTLFHRCKIPLPEAFLILYAVCCDPSISTYCISDNFGIRQMTCWKFKTKVTKYLNGNDNERKFTCLFTENSLFIE